MAQYSKDEKSIRFVGFSVHGKGSDKTYHFHTSAGENGKFIVWAELAEKGLTKVAYEIHRLPKTMSKVAALQSLLRRTLPAGLRKFLVEKLENMQSEPIVAVARRGRSNGRRSAGRRTTAHRKVSGRASGNRIAA